MIELILYIWVKLYAYTVIKTVLYNLLSGSNTFT